MAGKKVIAICQSGGEFETDGDGELQYKGGDAHAMEIESKMKFKDFKVEVAEMFSSDLSSMAIKYFLPGNRKTLISITNDKDFKRMINFHGDSGTTDIYVVPEEVAAPEVSNLPVSRSSTTTVSEAEAVPAEAVPVDVSGTMMTHVLDDMNEPSRLLDQTFELFGDTNNDSVTIDVPNEISVPTEIPIPIAMIGYDEKNAKAAQQWSNNITGVGQRFNSVHEFREALRKYAIAHQFAFKYKKNDSYRVTVKCKAEGCPWRIHASRLTTTPLICIKKMNSTHTCEGSVVKTSYKATRSWIASIIKDKLKIYPNYKPKDIVTDIKEEYGIQLNYFQAWRGKEIAKEQLQGSYKEAYGQLPYFCEKIMETNPGSLATFTTKEDSSFHRLFVSFHASLYGFEHGCRPCLFLDSIFLKAKYQGTLLTATAADADDGVFPVAFAIVDRESDDNWRWFLEQLKNAVSVKRGLTFVADKEKGLKESIEHVFDGEGGVYHAYCLRYMCEQLIRDLKGQFSNEVKRVMVEDLNAAALAPTLEGFQRCLDRIKHISVEAYNWIIKRDPYHWSNSLFPGARYNHLTANFGEIFYNWVSDANELPITQLVEAIRGKIMELFYARRAESNQWMTKLTPSMEDMLRKEIQVAPLQVIMQTGTKFEVRGETIETVDVNGCECTCKVWQLTGLPCCHAIQVIDCLSRDLYAYCSRYFTVESFRITYSESINPIPNLDIPLPKVNSKAALTVTPPATRRPPGRPTKKAPHEIRKRLPRCKKCKVTGHSTSKCQAQAQALMLDS